MLVYLASPYTSPDEFVREQRYDQVVEACARLIKASYHVISPIAHWHPIAMFHDLPHEFEFWLELDRKMIKACDEMWILTIDGWRESKGVTAEIAIAQNYGKMIQFLNAETLHLEPFRQ